MDISSESGKIVGKLMREIAQNETKNIANKLGYTTIKWGKITAVNGIYYTIVIDNKEYGQVKALVLSYTLAANDTVVCVVPNNQMSNMIIIGKVST